VTISTFKYACNMGRGKVITLLFGKGLIGPNSSLETTSPLVCAVKSGHIDVIRAVLNAGADVDGVWDRDCHQNPLCTAVRRNHEAAVKLLLKRGASYNRDKGGNEIDPLAQAKRRKRKNIYELIRQAKMKRERVDVPPFEGTKKLRR